MTSQIVKQLFVTILTILLNKKKFRSSYKNEEEASNNEWNDFEMNSNY